MHLFLFARSLRSVLYPRLLYPRLQPRVGVNCSDCNMQARNSENLQSNNEPTSLELIQDAMILVECIIKSLPSEPNDDISEDSTEATTTRILDRTIARMRYAFHETDSGNNDSAVRSEMFTDVAPDNAVPSKTSAVTNECTSNVSSGQEVADLDTRVSQLLGKDTAVAAEAVMVNSASYEFLSTDAPLSEDELQSMTDLELEESHARERFMNETEEKAAMDTDLPAAVTWFSPDQTLPYGYEEMHRKDAYPGAVELCTKNAVLADWTRKYGATQAAVEEMSGERKCVVDPPRVREIPIPSEELQWLNVFIQHDPTLLLAMQNLNVYLPTDAETMGTMKRELFPTPSAQQTVVKPESPVVQQFPPSINAAATQQFNTAIRENGVNPLDTTQRLSHVLQYAEHIMTCSNGNIVPSIATTNFAAVLTTQQQLTAIELLCSPNYDSLKNYWRKQTMLLFIFKQLQNTILQTRKDTIHSCIQQLSQLTNMLRQLNKTIAELSDSSNLIYETFADQRK